MIQKPTPQAERIRCGTPCGTVELLVCDGKLAGVRLLGRRVRAEGAPPASRAARRFAAALARHFRAEPTGVGVEDLDPSACTAFQARVYRELMKVGFGRLITYGELAARAGRPGAARAVGQAVGRNPWPVFVPCHRVVAAGKRVGGFSAGPQWKRSLLAHEDWTIADGRLKEANR